MHDTSDLVTNDIEMEDFSNTARGDIEMEASRVTEKSIRVRLYEEPKSWCHVRELDFLREPNGDVDLEKLGHILDTKGTVRVSSIAINSGRHTDKWRQVIDPHNFHPLRQHVPGIL